MVKAASKLKRFGDKQGSLRVTIPFDIWRSIGWGDGDIILFETQLDGSVSLKKI